MYIYTCIQTCVYLNSCGCIASLFFLTFLKKLGSQAVEIESFDSGGFEARETSMISGK